MQRLKKGINLYMLHGFEIVTHGNEMTFNIEINNLNLMVTKHK